jgi:hypothetical protein
LETRDFFGWSSTETAEHYTHGAKIADIKRRVAANLPDVRRRGPQP